MEADGVQRYGGDFVGELTNDKNFCCDGMVFADRTLKSGSLEVKAAYQPMKTELKMCIRDSQGAAITVRAFFGVVRDSE